MTIGQMEEIMARWDNYDVLFPRNPDCCPVALALVTMYGSDRNIKVVTPTVTIAMDAENSYICWQNPDWVVSLVKIIDRVPVSYVTAQEVSLTLLKIRRGLL